MSSHSRFYSFVRNTFFIIAGAIGGSALLYHLYIAPPAQFPPSYHLTIKSGQTLGSISEELAREHVIRSSHVFKAIMLILGSDTSISEGEYSFTRPTTVITIALQISGKEFGIEKKKVTFPEGYTVKEMGDRLVQVFPEFDQRTFLTLAKKSEGFLFPDTYRFFTTPTAPFVLETLQKTYALKIASLQSDITLSGHSEGEIIIMASIIEKEAKGNEDRAVIAGILWKRLRAGMLLQVDASSLYAPTDTRYNTYTHKGLTPTPIGNPGLAAITAALYPVASPYLYYLHDSSGAIHYASTYEEHKKNIDRYLR